MTQTLSRRKLYFYRFNRLSNVSLNKCVEFNVKKSSLINQLKNNWICIRQRNMAEVCNAFFITVFDELHEPAGATKLLFLVSRVPCVCAWFLNSYIKCTQDTTTNYTRCSIDTHAI